MAHDDIDLADALAQLSLLVQGTLAARAGADDLSLVQTRLLGILRDRRPTMNELAKLLELDKSSVTGLVDRAEKRGLVQRSASTTDGRSTVVGLTSAGRRLIRTVSARFSADIESIVGGLSAADRRALARIARHLVHDYAADRDIDLAPSAVRGARRL